MIVRLSAQQWAVCVKYGTERHVDYLERFTRPNRHFYQVNLPAAGLQALIHEFEKIVFTPAWGKRRSKIPERSLRALRTLAVALNTWTTHPAFDGGAVPGIRYEVLAAWVDGARYVPFPNGNRFVTLLPDVQPWRVAGDDMTITRWTPGQITHCQIEVVDEAEHLGWL